MPSDRGEPIYAVVLDFIEAEDEWRATVVRVRDSAPLGKTFGPDVGDVLDSVRTITERDWEGR